MYSVSIIRLRVRSLWLMPLFIFHALRTMTQAQRADGQKGLEPASRKTTLFGQKRSGKAKRP